MSGATLSLSYPHICQSWLGSCLEVLLPTACVVCERPLRGALICYRCRPALPDLRSIQHNRCTQCFTVASASRAGESLCDVCVLHPPMLDSIRFLWEYHGLARDLIRTMKYRPSVALARLGGALLCDALPHIFAHTSWDLIVPIPASHAMFRRRLFHPCTELAQASSKRYSIAIRDALIHATKRAPQASLDHAARLRNLTHLFKVSRPHVVQGKHILLIEDVITTGATSAAAAYALRNAGATQVDILALARTQVWSRFRAQLGRLPLFKKGPVTCSDGPLGTLCGYA
jgi:ComF family protein